MRTECSAAVPAARVPPSGEMATAKISPVISVMDGSGVGAPWSGTAPQVHRAPDAAAASSRPSGEKTTLLSACPEPVREVGRGWSLTLHQQAAACDVLDAVKTAVRAEGEAEDAPGAFGE